MALKKSCTDSGDNLVSGPEKQGFFVFVWVEGWRRQRQQKLVDGALFVHTEFFSGGGGERNLLAVGSGEKINASLFVIIIVCRETTSG